MSFNFDAHLEYFKNHEKISDKNKEAFLWFINECAAEGICPRRQSKYITGFIALFTGFMPLELNFAKASSNELKSIVAGIHRSKYSDSTKQFLKVCIKKFFKLKNNGVYPPKVSFIKTSLKKSTPVRKEDLYSYDQIRKIISQFSNMRDKAFVFTLYESGARTGELLNAKLSDAIFDESGDRIRLYGLKNTPNRENQLIESGFYLKEWIRCHPLGGDPFNVLDPRAPLWINLKSSGFIKEHRLEPLDHRNIARIFKEACIKTGIKKRSYRMYNLRHTRITEISKFMSHEQICKFAGWVPGSGQFDIYVHLTSEDVNKTLREHYGIGSNQSEEPVICKVCWKKSPPNSKECFNCRRPLNVQGLKERSRADEIREALRVLAELQAEGKLDELKSLISN